MHWCYHSLSILLSGLFDRLLGFDWLLLLSRWVFWGFIDYFFVDIFDGFLEERQQIERCFGLLAVLGWLLPLFLDYLFLRPLHNELHIQELPSFGHPANIPLPILIYHCIAHLCRVLLRLAVLWRLMKDRLFFILGLAGHLSDSFERRPFEFGDSLHVERVGDSLPFAFAEVAFGVVIHFKYRCEINQDYELLAWC